MRNLTKVLILFFSGFFFFATAASSISLFNIPDPSKSPRLLKIRLPFDTAQAEIGIDKRGYIEDTNKKHNLNALTRYVIKLNASGNYTLFIVRNGRENKIDELKLPFSLRSESANPMIYFNGSWYNGGLEFKSLHTGIIAINEVDVEKAINGILGSMVKVNNSTEAIKAASVIIRSTLFAITLTTPEDYHLIAKSINYEGLPSEKDFLDDLIKQTDGEVLFTKKGEVLYTPLRSAATEGSLPFEMIGGETKAWEKVMALSEVESILNREEYTAGQIYSIKATAPSSMIDFYSYENGSVITIEGSNGSSQMTLAKAQKVFMLPSSYFRVYSFTDSQRREMIQFIGSIPMSKYVSNVTLYNLVSSINETSNPFTNYKDVLKRLYPEAYIGRV
ncbi:MAG: SpoIID/LytB domain-containing protein [Candidatus Caenarcaniphilales bacterium]|nr:SpoIID/LytB domain-containing protein [Candidatus Caenarcaniphilales bacterium]